MEGRYSRKHEPCASHVQEDPFAVELKSIKQVAGEDIEEDGPDVSNIGEDGKDRPSELLYCIDDLPPWYLAIGLGFQQYMLMFGGTVTMPFILSGPFCFQDKPVVISNILSTTLFVSGMVTFLQTTIGCRLPIIQGSTFAFLAPIFSSMALRGPCPSSSPSTTGTPNATQSSLSFNADDEEWKSRLQEVQGAIILAAIVQIIIGWSGLMGLLLRFIGPLTIVPTIVLLGLPLFDTAASYSSTQWGIATLTIVTVILFSQCLKEVPIPVPFYKKGQWRILRFQIFKLFPIIISILISWIFCVILTATDVLPPGHKARTDARLSVLRNVPWIRVPYPGQWGAPTFKASTFIGMLAGVVASMMESISDYYACAKMSGAPPPPSHAINRGLGVEGLGCILTGIWGTGNGTTSYSENVAALGITRVGSRRVIQFGAIFMILLAVIGKFGALFITIPDPVIGGNFICLFGLLVGVGLSPLQYVNLNSIRNQFIIGNALFIGLVVPFWIKGTPAAIKTGSREFDQISTVLLSTPMAVGGITGFILDNILPGSLEDRGIIQWKKGTIEGSGDSGSAASIHTYDIPFITPYLQKFSIVKYLPFLPYYGRDYFDNRTKGARKQP